MVVEVAVTARHDHFVRHAGRVRKPVHSTRVKSGHAGRLPQHQAGRRTRGHISGLGTRGLRDHTPRPRLQFRDIHAVLGCLLHRLRHLFRHDRAAQPGHRTSCVHDCANAQLFIDIPHSLAFSWFNHPLKVIPPVSHDKAIRDFRRNHCLYTFSVTR